MSSLLGGGGGLAGLARVSFETTGVGEVTRDIDLVQREYRSSTQAMSDDALKVQLAQDRLQRSLRKGPGAYREQARAELSLRNAERQLRGETDSLTRAQERNQRGLGSLRRSLVGLAAGYIGAQGFITLARSSVRAAREEELVMGQTRIAVEQLGLEYERNAPKIERQIALVRQLGFDDEELAKSFQTLVRSTGSVDEALEQLNLVADVSRGRYIDLEAATQIVNKANLGMSGGLRRIGIDVDKNASRMELLAALNRSYGRSAEEAMDTGVAAADRFSVAVEEIQEAIGRGLAPSLARASEEITEWISKEENLERVQRNVTDAVELGEQAVRGIAGALKIVKTVGEPVVDVLGGVERTVKLITLAWVAFKVKAVLSFGATAAASSATSAKMVRDATVAGRAWDLATRPRVMPVTTVGGGAPGAPGGPFGPGGRGAPRTGPAPGGGRFEWVRGIGWLLVGGLAGTAGQEGSSGGGAPGTLTTVNDFAGLLRMAREGRLPESTIATLLSGGHISPQQARQLRAASRAAPPATGDPVAGDRPIAGEGPRTAPVPSRGGGGGGSRRTIDDILTDIAREETRLGTGPELRLHRELLGRYNAQIRALEARKNLTAEQKEKLRTLYGQVASEQAAIDAIIGDGEAKIDAQRETATTKRAAAAKAAKARQDRIDAAAVRAADARRDLFAGTGGNRQNMRRAALANVPEVVKGLKEKQAARDEQRGLTEADVRRLHAEFLTGLQGITNQFGSNFTPDGGALGRIATHAAAQTDILLEQNERLGYLSRTVHHPGAKYVKSEWGVAIGGVAAI